LELQSTLAVTCLVLKVSVPLTVQVEYFRLLLLSQPVSRTISTEQRISGFIDFNRCGKTIRQRAIGPEQCARQPIVLYLLQLPAICLKHIPLKPGSRSA